MKPLSLCHFLLPLGALAVNPTVHLSYASYEGTSLSNGITQWLGMRFAAPPVGERRFKPPEDPLREHGIQRADEHGLLCLDTGGSPTSNKTSEDCLFLDLYAPSHATSKSKLPVYFFIQGGGFDTDANANYNGSGLIEAAGQNIIVVNFNYRVSLYGFLASQEVVEGGATNNGLRDQYKALQWVQKHIAKFGGDPKHVVLGGDSAGAASILLLLTAYGGRDQKLFIGSAADSPSFGTQFTVSESQNQYDNLVIRAGCSNTTDGDTLKCLRSLTARDLQAVNSNPSLLGALNPPVYQYNAAVDRELVPDYTYKLMRQGKFIKIPTIWGDDTNGGSKFCPKDTANFSQSNAFLRDQFPALKLSQILRLNKLYQQTDQRFPGTGDYYRQCGNVYGDMRYMCPTLYAGKRLAESKQPSWVYRYNVLDPEDAAQGLGVPHTAELDAIWGPDNTDGNASASYNLQNGTNRFVIPVIQGYWTSFIKTLDPNKERYKGSPVWEAWDPKGDVWQRLRFQTNATAMETVDQGIPGQRERSKLRRNIAPSAHNHPRFNLNGISSFLSVDSNTRSGRGIRVMDANMSNYPPPDQQYSSAYPVATAAPQQSPDTAIEQLQSSLGQQQVYGSNSIDGAFGQRVEDSIAQLESAAQRATEVSDGALAEQAQQHVGTGVSGQSSTDASPRTNRLRKACDSCSIRKVKCDESGPPCRACANLDIPCTFDRPSRRRGPPNRHAEMIKRRRLEADNGAGDYLGASAHAAEALAALGGAALSAQQQSFSADSIAPRDIVQRLVNDFFTYIHPLAPFPHEPMFMSAFHQRQDATNKIFVAMLAAMVGTVVAAYPKRLRTHYRALGYQRVEAAEPFVQNCINICVSSRGAGYLDRPDFDVNTYDAITSYLLGQIYVQKNLLRQGCRYFAEALAILRGCGLQSPQNSAIRQAQLNPLNKDFVHQELAQRLWWRLYIVLKQMQQARIESPELEFALSGPTPPQPTERDDAYIFTDNYDDQPYGATSELTGFRIYLTIYQTLGDLEAINLVNSTDGNPDYKQRRAIVKEVLDNVKQIQNLPEPANTAYEQLQQYLNGRQPGGDEAREEQRAMQVTVQRAMIDMAIISTRLQVVEAFWRVDDAQKSDEKDDDRSDMQLQMKEERASIVKDLIQLLAHVSQTMVELSLDQFADQFKRLARTLSERQPDRKAKQMPEDIAWFTRLSNLIDRAQKVANQVEGTFSDDYETMTWNDWRVAQEQSPSVAIE